MDKGKRLRILREKANFTLEEVGKMIGVSRQTLQRYESGVISNIPSDKIEQLANIYHSTPTYIMGWSDYDTGATSEMVFTDATEALKFILKQEVLMAYGGYDLNTMEDQDIIDMANDILYAVKLSAERQKKKGKVNVMQWITDIVSGLVEQCGTNDVYSLCDAPNIEIIRNFHNRKIKSYFLRGAFGSEFIYLNNDLDPREERALVAHELGHAILHTDLGIAFYKGNPVINKCKLERQADYFAAKLLTWDIDIRDYCWEDQTFEQLAEEIEIYTPILKAAL